MSLAIRQAQPLDAGKIGAILTQSVRDQTWLPVLHSEAENIHFFGRMIDHGLVWVADDGVVRGFLAREEDYIHALYVARGARGHGIGAALLRAAQAVCGRLELYTFVANTGARRFYQRHGFAEVDRTDGSQNDEGLPDVFMVWEGAHHGG
ncbi:GNAT family N-acetyltransferase [Pseudooceanicola onchidii]|uniref:GNAT family N-acetyltransferase n=1 Tax=Pseudooceanicola onchidii TaxID=2562279 RepID=UPI0010AB4055|nr:GNAT family N-acetyltransferase [Pseudooceanicola onchidii]